MGLLRPNCLLVQHRPHQSSQLKAGHIKFFETLIPEYPKQEATLTCLEDLVEQGYQDIDVKQRPHASESKLCPELNDQLVRDHPTPI